MFSPAIYCREWNPPLFIQTGFKPGLDCFWEGGNPGTEVPG